MSGKLLTHDTLERDKKSNIHLKRYSPIPDRYHSQASIWNEGGSARAIAFNFRAGQWRLG